MSNFEEVILNNHNVEQFSPFVDCFIVSTRLLISGLEDFDKDKVKELMDVVRS